MKYLEKMTSFAATRTTAVTLAACLLTACTPDTEALPPIVSATAVDERGDLEELPPVDLPRLRVAANDRQLVRADEEPIFLLGDSAWSLVWKLGRTEVREYLDKRRSQGFNAIAVRAFSSRHTYPNAYGDRPFGVRDGDWDFSVVDATPGSSPGDADAYDYWDHLDYIIRAAGSAGMYVLLSPVHGRFIAGAWNEIDSSGILLDAESAYAVGSIFGERYADHSNVVWVIGGDRSPSTEFGNYEAVYRALALGVSDGVNGGSCDCASPDFSTTLMTYWPRKYRANSSYWFHRDPWLDFNSVQDMPRDQITSLAHDRAQLPLKPTWLFEGRYEEYTPAFTDYQTRLQAYQSVFSGGFGFLFGHEVTYFFGVDWIRREGDAEIWRASLDAPGAVQMRHLQTLMSALLARHPELPEPATGLLREGAATGPVGDLSSDRLFALRHPRAEYVAIYAPQGGIVDLDTGRLNFEPAEARWFDPRTGTVTLAGPGSAVDDGWLRFRSPEPDSDWVLLVSAGILIAE